MQTNDFRRFNLVGCRPAHHPQRPDWQLTSFPHTGGSYEIRNITSVPVYC